MVRIPKESERFLDWFIENYGCNGMENYTYDQNQRILGALSDILQVAGQVELQVAGQVELEFLGKVLLQLSNKGGNYLGQVQDDLSLMVTGGDGDYEF